MSQGKHKERNRLTPTCLSVFACLKDAKGFKGSDEDRTWNITVKMTPEQGAVFEEELKDLAALLQIDEKEERLKSKRPMRDVPAYLNVKKDDDGNYVWNFKKKEKTGAPPVLLDYNRNPIEKVVRPGTKVQIAYNVRPYVMPSTNLFGVALDLIAVRLMDHDLPPEEVQEMFAKVSKEKINIDDIF